MNIVCLLIWIMQFIICIIKIFTGDSIDGVTFFCSNFVCFVCFLDLLISDEYGDSSTLIKMYYAFFTLGFGCTTLLGIAWSIAGAKHNLYIYLVSVVFCIALYSRKIAKKSLKERGFW